MEMRWWMLICSKWQGLVLWRAFNGNLKDWIGSCSNQLCWEFWEFFNLVVAIPFMETYELALVHVGTNFGNFKNLT